MQLYLLGALPWKESQLIYHALPFAMKEQELDGALLIHRTREPYFCLGIRQSILDEIDLEYCSAHNIHVFKREVGGGGVLLDQNQLFYHLILHRKHPLVPSCVPFCRAKFFNKFLAPVIETYRHFAVDAHFVPEDEIAVEDRKISGNGVMVQSDYIVLAGSMLLDFDYDTMTDIVKVPNEPFRERLRALIHSRLTSFTRELPEVPPLEEIQNVLVRTFEGLLGSLHPAPLPEGLERYQSQLDSKYSSKKWLERRGTKRINATQVIKIRGGHYLRYDRSETLENTDGLITEIRDGAIIDTVMIYNGKAVSRPDLEHLVIGITINPEDTQADLEKRILEKVS